MPLQILTGLGVPSEAERLAQWDDDLLKSLRAEVHILAHLRHPNVVLFLGVCLQPPCVVTGRWQGGCFWLHGMLCSAVVSCGQETSPKPLIAASLTLHQSITSCWHTVCKDITFTLYT